MKMPTRPWYPPIKPRPDIFGLYHTSLLEAACETPTQRERRFAKVEAGVVEAFKAAIHHLGDEQARQLFQQVLRLPKRGRGKALANDRDQRLLAAYDEAMQKGETVAVLARRLRSTGIELGNTPRAIAVQIHALVKQRKQRMRATAIDARRWRMALRNEPPTLLEMIAGKK
jgi:hypothetical protein